MHVCCKGYIDKLAHSPTLNAIMHVSYSPLFIIIIIIIIIVVVIIIIKSPSFQVDFSFKHAIKRFVQPLLSRRQPRLIGFMVCSLG